MTIITNLFFIDLFFKKGLIAVYFRLSENIPVSKDWFMRNGSGPEIIRVLAFSTDVGILPQLTDILF